MTVRRLKCSKCGTIAEVPVGQKPECRHCGFGRPGQQAAVPAPVTETSGMSESRREAPATKRCPYCAEEILAAARKCKHCGEFLDPALKQAGRAVFKASSAFIGLACAYHVMDGAGSVLARLKPGEAFEMPVNSETTVWVKRTGAFGSPKPVQCLPHQVNRFSLTTSQSGMGLVVARVDIIDSDS